MRTQYQVQNGTNIGKNQKVFENDNDELEIKRFDKQEENGQTLVKVGLFIKLGKEENLTRNNTNNLNSRSQSDYQIIKQEMKFSGRRF